jgi:hypothetical protein
VDEARKSAIVILIGRDGFRIGIRLCVWLKRVGIGHQIGRIIFVFLESGEYCSSFRRLKVNIEYQRAEGRELTGLRALPNSYFWSVKRPAQAKHLTSIARHFGQVNKNYGIIGILRDDIFYFGNMMLCTAPLIIYLIDFWFLHDSGGICDHRHLIDRPRL